MRNYPFESANELSGAPARAREVHLLKKELRTLTEACAEANRRGQVGNLFFLSRKKWRLIQLLSEAETEAAACSGEKEKVLSSSRLSLEQELITGS